MKRAKVWLQRVGYTRGFGVQSPWAYGLVRYVINEHYPYYAYEELEQVFAQAEPTEKKLGALYFRLANHCQPRAWGFAIDNPELKARYVEAGCRGTRVVRKSEMVTQSPEDLDVLVMGIDDATMERFQQFAQSARPSSLLIVEGIRRNRKAHRAWREMTRSALSGVTFDLYYCGLIFFDMKLYKQSYKVNF